MILITGDPGQYDRLIGCGYASLKKPFLLAELMSMLGKVLRRIDAECEPRRANTSM